MNKLIVLMGSATLVCGCAADGEPVSAEPEAKAQQLQAADASNVRNITLPVTTQGPFWPPSEVSDEDGNFVVVGINITEVSPGVVAPVGNSAVIVSKDTVPPLDAQGVETPYNWFAKPFKVVRNLDLSPGSPDLDMVLYSQSFGPFVGDFGPTPRIPAEGDSLYNLNGLPNTCPELVPVGDQARLYKRPQYPLHRVPIFGFQGDGIAHDATTHEEINPIDHPGFEGLAATGPNCPYEGCSGEDEISFRREEPIRLGEWMNAQGALRVELVNYDASQNGYTHAQFDFDFHSMIPDSVYTVWAVRPRNAPTATQAHRLVQPLGIPNVIRTDRFGDVKVSFVVPNPFPDPSTDTFGRRIAGLNIVFHSDMQNWGACFSRHPAGVDAHAHFSTFVDGTFDFTDLITVPPRH